MFYFNIHYFQTSFKPISELRCYNLIFLIESNPHFKPLQDLYLHKMVFKDNYVIYLKTFHRNLTRLYKYVLLVWTEVRSLQSPLHHKIRQKAVTCHYRSQGQGRSATFLSFVNPSNSVVTGLIGDYLRQKMLFLDIRGLN